MRTRLRWSAVVTLPLLSILAGVAPALAAPPSNDDFDSATIITVLPFSDIVDTSEATVAPDDPGVSCAFGTLSSTVWYSFTPAADMRIRADVSASNYFNVVAAYTGTRGALTEVGCASPFLTIDVSAGVTYRFMDFTLVGYVPGTLTFKLYEPIPVTAAVTIDATGLATSCSRTGSSSAGGTRFRSSRAPASR